MTVAAELKQRLSIRAKAFLSNPDEVNDEHLATACDEALEIAGKSTPMPALSDIAYYRFLLLSEINGVNDNDFKAYKLALKQVVVDETDDTQTFKTGIGKPVSKTRANSYL